MDLYDDADIGELDFYDMDKFAFWLDAKLSNSIRIGDQVKDRYGRFGIIVEEFENFSDLVSKAKFLTMSASEWLDCQKIPITDEQLREKWFTIECHSGGAAWAFESSLIKQ